MPSGLSTICRKFVPMYLRQKCKSSGTALSAYMTHVVSFNRYRHHDKRISYLHTCVQTFDRLGEDCCFRGRALIFQNNNSTWLSFERRTHSTYSKTPPALRNNNKRGAGMLLWGMGLEGCLITIEKGVIVTLQAAVIPNSISSSSSSSSRSSSRSSSSNNKIK